MVLRVLKKILQSKKAIFCFGVKKRLLTILILFFVTVPVVSFAYNSYEVINNVVNSVNTGGNSAEAGEVIEGEAKSEVKVYTEVNGEVVEDFHQVWEEEGEFEYQVKKEFEGGQVETKVDIKTNESKTDMSRFNLDNLDIQTNQTTTSSETEVSKTVFDTFKWEISKIIDYVFSFFKF